MSPRSRRFRQSSSTWKWWMVRYGVFAGLVILGLVSYQWVPSAVAGWTSIQHVSISGTDRIDRRDILSLLALPEDSSLLSVDLATLERKVAAHPWVASASVGRALPHTLAVIVVERKPAAVLPHVGGELFLDKEGVVLSIASDMPTGRFPRLVGLPAVKLLGGDKATRGRARTGLIFAEHLQQRFGLPVTVDVSDSRFISGRTDAFVFLVKEAFLPMWQQYLRLEPSIREKLHQNPHEIDLRFAGKVIVRKKG